MQSFLCWYTRNVQGQSIFSGSIDSFRPQLVHWHFNIRDLLSEGNVMRRTPQTGFLHSILISTSDAKSDSFSLLIVDDFVREHAFF